MNKEKSCIFFFNTRPQTQQAISTILGVKKGKLPFKFLGAQIFEGVCRAKHWGEVVENFRNKAMAWKNNWISMAERITMAKVVLSTIPINAMSCLEAPGKTINELEKILKNF